MPLTGAKLKVCGHKNWPGAITTSFVMLHCTLFVLLCSDLLNKYISSTILVFHHCSAWGHRDKCRTGGGLLEADKTAFVFLPFEVPLVWHGWYGWLAQQIDLAGVGHMWEITHGHGQMKGFGTLLVTTAVTDLYFDGGTLSSAPAPYC